MKNVGTESPTRELFIHFDSEKVWTCDFLKGPEVIKSP